MLGWGSYVDPTFRRPAHIRLLGEHLMAVERGEITRLVVEMPPRHGKSETTTVKFPAWYLGRHPDRRLIIAAHTAHLAARFSMRARNDFAQYASEAWGLKVDPEVSAMYRWDVLDDSAPPGQPPGGMIAAGIGGPITGQGAHLVIIDDPVKDAEAANSKVQRDAIWDWYRFVLRTRLFPGAAVILVLTRWHEDDLVGRLLHVAEDGQGDQWTILRLPALAEEGDPLGRKPGEALWPEQYDGEALKATRASVGSYVFAALYQQRPAPAEGALFKRSHFRYFRREGTEYVLLHPEGARRVPVDSCWRFQTVDPAATEKEQSDWFVCATWAVTPEKDLLLLDVFRERAETTKHESILAGLRSRWQPSFQGVEEKTFGLNIIQSLKRKGLPVKPLKADRDKVSRARVAQARYEVGAVYHLENAPWLEALESELLAFPGGAHDDQVDAVAYAAIEVAGKSQPRGYSSKPRGW